MPVEAMSVNSLPWTSVLDEPYMTLRPAPPSWVKRFAVNVTFLAALTATFARGWVRAPHGHEPAGEEKVHMPWLALVAPPVAGSDIRRLLCTSENPSPPEGAFHVAWENSRPLNVRWCTGLARLPATCTSDSRRGSSTSSAPGS